MKNLLSVFLFFCCASLPAQSTAIDSFAVKYILKTITKSGLTERDGYWNPPIESITDNTGTLRDFLEPVDFFLQRTTQDSFVEVVHRTSGIKEYKFEIEFSDLGTVSSYFLLYNKEVIACSIKMTPKRVALDLWSDNRICKVLVFDLRKEPEIYQQEIEIYGTYNFPGPIELLSDTEFLKNAQKILLCSRKI